MHARRLRTCPRDRRRPGAVAIVMVLVMVLLAVVVAGTTISAGRRGDSLRREVEATRALYLAESGLALALRELALGVDADGDGAIGSVASIDARLLQGPTGAVARSETLDGIVLSSVATAGTSRRRIRALAVPGRADAGDGTGWPGLVARYYIVRGAVPTRLDHVPWNATPDAWSIVPEIRWPAVSDTSAPFWIGGPASNYGARFTGRVRVDRSGTWEFRTTSDDGSGLWINDTHVVSNDDRHAMRSRTGALHLDDGWHELDLRFFEATGSHGLLLEWRGPGHGSWTVIPSSHLAHEDRHQPGPPPHLALSERFTMAGANPVQCWIRGASGTTPRLLVNATDAGVVSIARATVQGDVLAGPGADPRTAIAVGAQGSISGDRGSARIPFVHARIALPADLPASGGAVTHGNGTFVYASDFRLASWTLRNNAVVMIEGDVTGHITGDLVLQNRAQIALAPGASLRLFIDGDLTMAGQSAINASGSADPSRVRMLLAAPEAVAALQGNAQMRAHLVIPYGDIEMRPAPQSNSFEFTGVLLGRRMTMEQRATVTALPTAILLDGAGAGGGAGCSLLTWGERPPDEDEEFPGNAP